MTLFRNKAKAKEKKNSYYLNRTEFSYPQEFSVFLFALILNKVYDHFLFILFESLLLKFIAVFTLEIKRPFYK